MARHRDVVNLVGIICVITSHLFSCNDKVSDARVGIDFTLLNYLRLVDFLLMFYKCLL